MWVTSENCPVASVSRSRSGIAVNSRLMTRTSNRGRAAFRTIRQVCGTRRSNGRRPSSRACAAIHLLIRRSSVTRSWRVTRGLAKWKGRPQMRSKTFFLSALVCMVASFMTFGHDAVAATCNGGQLPLGNGGDLVVDDHCIVGTADVYRYGNVNIIASGILEFKEAQTADIHFWAK